MNYVKNALACMMMISLLLSSSISSAIGWGLPDQSTWQRAKDYAGSFVPDWSTWEKVKSYGPPIGLSTAGAYAFSKLSRSHSPSPEDILFKVPAVEAGYMLAPGLLSRADYLQRSTQEREKRAPKWHYLARPLGLQGAAIALGSLLSGGGIPNKYELKRFFNSYLPFLIATPALIPGLIAMLSEYYDEWKAEQAANPSSPPQE